jgi:hypothetical protein
MWRWLIGMPEALKELPLPTAALLTLEHQRTQHKWSPTTWDRLLGSTLGALAHATLYTNSPVDLAVTHTATWKDALRQARQEANAATTRAAVPATPGLVERCVSSVPSPVAEQVALAWLTAGRVGCILQLKGENVTLDGSKLTVQFRRGKGVKARGPYTVHTECPTAWLPKLQALLQRPKDQWLWPQPTPAARTAASRALTASLRGIHPTLEQRSLRRGALQAMASAGVEEPTLLQYSGHTNVAMLRRYLDWGRKGEGLAVAARAAAAHLRTGTA